ncbi:MAG: ChbG/HpnK family deacetylase [Spirochaetales bacterium]
MSTIRLVTRADDAGMHTAANHAIAETIKNGIVQNVSLMAPTSAIRNAYQTLSEFAGKVDFGLHVALTCEWQNLRWQALTAKHGGDGFTRRDGTMHVSVDEFIEAKPDLDAVMAEVEAQLELLTNLGFSISYIDEHMLVGRTPGLAERLADFATSHGLVYDRTLRENGTLADFPSWAGPREHPGTELADQLSTMDDGTYLLVGHPVNKDEELQRIHLRDEPAGKMLQDRNRQRRMFMDIEIVDYCENVGIELCRYTRL